MTEKLTGMRRNIVAVILIVSALLSFTWLSGVLSSPSTYRATIETIDEQKGKAMALNVAVTSASTAISLLPDDTASPIAEELADLSLPLFLVLCILYAEKYLLTTFGWVAGVFLIPGACILEALHLYVDQEKLRVWSKKLVILALALVMIIPLSTVFTRHVEQTFAESTEQVLNQALGVEDDENDEEENGFVAFFNELKDNASALVNAAKDMLGIMAEAVVVLLITSCVIPVLTMLLYLWILQRIMSVDIPIEKAVLIMTPKWLKRVGRKAAEKTKE